MQKRHLCHVEHGHESCPNVVWNIQTETSVSVVSTHTHRQIHCHALWKLVDFAYIFMPMRSLIVGNFRETLRAFSPYCRAAKGKNITLSSQFHSHSPPTSIFIRMLLQSFLFHCIFSTHSALTMMPCILDVFNLFTQHQHMTSEWLLFLDYRSILSL